MSYLVHLGETNNNKKKNRTDLEADMERAKEKMEEKSGVLIKQINKLALGSVKDSWKLLAFHFNTTYC